MTDSGTDPPPHRRGLRWPTDTRANQHLQLVCLHDRCCLSALDGHQRNFPFDNRLWHSQKPWPSYTRIFTAVARRLRKTKTGPAEWIQAERPPAKLGQSIYPTAKIGGLDGHQHPHLWRDLDHAHRPWNALASAGKSRCWPAASLITILSPCTTTNSTSGPRAGAGVVASGAGRSSTNGTRRLPHLSVGRPPVPEATRYLSDS